MNDVTESQEVIESPTELDKNKNKLYLLVNRNLVKSDLNEE